MVPTALLIGEQFGRGQKERRIGKRYILRSRKMLRGLSYHASHVRDKFLERKKKKTKKRKSKVNNASQNSRL